ncbi:MAG: Bax inhibitor-1/YccA family protein [Candidatus Eremiobacteraeota bacterium]|nr:Bax inhibitor-1/YccA family protein [Candidatus Eremiobacteraeota bacterium]
MAVRSGNPALNQNTFLNLAPAGERSDAMTLQGTVNKTAILLLLLMATSIYVWQMFFSSRSVALVYPLMIGGAIGGFIFALLTAFVKNWAPVTAPVYALLEGLLIGGLSALLETSYPGIVIQAVALTFATMASLLFIYKSGLIKVTDQFRLGVVAATGGICLVYLATMILGFFNISIPYIHSGGPIGILFSLFVVVMAALNLVLDFDFIETGVKQGAPKYMEWYGAFGLMVTLVWLYVEILRLLTKLRSRD